MAAKLRAVLAGCGGISGVWFEVVKKIEEVQIVGLVDLNEAAARKRAEEFSIQDPVIGSDLAKVISDSGANVVFDCTVPDSHANIVVTALEAGCDVLGEKPMADTMANARRMVATAERTGRTYAVIQNRRYLPSMRRVRAFLESGAIGQIHTLNSEFFLGCHFGGFRDEMRHVLLLDMAIHTFDGARLLSGADPVTVWAKDWNPAGSWYAHGASAIAVFEMSNGIVYTYRGSWCAEGLSTTWECDWHMVGTRGSMRFDGAENARAQRVTGGEGFVRPVEDVEVPPVDPAARVGGHDGVIRDFVQSILAGTKPETICTDNIKSLAMVLGAIKSAETGHIVEIDKI